MAVVALRENAWNAGNDSQKWAMRLAARKVELGQPAVYEQPNGTRWLIASDSRLSLLDVAILGTVAAGLAAFPNWTVPADKETARSEVYDFVKATIVLPKDIAYTEIVQVEVPVRVQVEVLDANGDPFDPPVFQWVDDPLGTTQLVDVEQSLGDPYALTLAAQGAPTWLAARESIPNGLSPVEVTV